MGRPTDKPVESILKDNNTVLLHSFMVNDLHLSGNELIVFAVIYSFSQDGESSFYGSRKYLASWCQVHEGAVDYQLNKLLEKGFIIKTHTRREDGSLCSIIKANLPLIESITGHSQKFESGVSKIYSDHSQKFMTNIKEDNKEHKDDSGKMKGKYPKTIQCNCGGEMVKTACSQTGTGRPYYRCVACGLEEVYRG